MFVWFIKAVPEMVSIMVVLGETGGIKEVHTPCNVDVPVNKLAVTPPLVVVAVVELLIA